MCKHAVALALHHLNPSAGSAGRQVAAEPGAVFATRDELEQWAAEHRVTHPVLGLALDGIERTLDPAISVICDGDGSRAMGIGGVNPVGLDYVCKNKDHYVVNLRYLSKSSNPTAESREH
jgi:hypothetical protein